MKKRLAFIDHSYHKKTKSTSVLIKLLNKYFEVDVFWDYAWNNGTQVDLEIISEKRYDVIIFYQIIYPVSLINALDCDNIIIIPMYDNHGETPVDFWHQYRDFKFVNFSKTLHLRLKNLNISTKYFQYFLPPNEFLPQKNDFSKLRGFFWQRREHITWKQIRVLIKGTPFENIHLHKAVDPPGFDFIAPSEDEISKYNITISEWFPDKEDFFKVLRSTNVFFAPRLNEGIGMSFIEAMTMGQCVVAPNTPTMNEYIRDGETGLLYDPGNPVPLDFSNAKQIANNAREYCKKGYERWIESEGELIDFVYPNTSFKAKFFESKSIKSLVFDIFNETLRQKDEVIRQQNKLIRQKEFQLEQQRDDFIRLLNQERVQIDLLKAEKEMILNCLTLRLTAPLRKLWHLLPESCTALCKKFLAPK